LSGADFPKVSWRKAVNTTLNRPSKTLKYDDPLGSMALRKALRAYLWRSRGVRCDEQQIVIVNGSQQGIDLCARLLLNPGDKVVVEEPGYMLARHAFEAIGATSVPILVDQDGMRTALLDGVAAKLAYVTPSHQFPLGGVLPVSRRQELLTWSRKSRAFIIEDDYDGEYRYDTKPTETLHSLDTERRVIYLGTMSKTLSPELRLGYLVIPTELSASFALAKRLVDRHSALLQQRALQVSIESGALERHIRRVRRFNQKRRDLVRSRIGALLGDQASVTGAAAGLHVVVWFDRIPIKREDELISEAGKRGLGLYGINPLYSSERNRANEKRAGVVLGYAALTEAQITKGIQLLAKLLHDFGAVRQMEVPS
jgi:GntR family transcriptional regulator/MocR family aminotransferase